MEISSKESGYDRQKEEGNKKKKKGTVKDIR